MKVEAYSGVAALPPPAAALLAGLGRRNPFMAPAWLGAFEHYLLGARERPLYLVAEDAGRACAVLPLLVEHRPLAGAVRLRALANFYTGVFEAAYDPAIHADASRRAGCAAALAAFVRRRLPRLALVELAPVREAQSLAAAFVEALRGEGYASRRFEAHGNWYEPVAGLDFPAYLARRPGKLRSTLERKRRKLERERASELLACREPAAVRAHFPDYEQVYARSWKTAERSPAFIRTVMEALAAEDRVTLGVLKIDGEPAASQIWVKIDSAWAVFKLAFDPRFTDYSAGTLLMAQLIEGFFAAGPVQALDFLSGDDPYKRDWATQRRPHWGYEAIAGASLLGRALRAKRYLTGVALSGPQPGAEK